MIPILRLQKKKKVCGGKWQNKAKLQESKSMDNTLPLSVSHIHAVQGKNPQAILSNWPITSSFL